MKDVEIKKNGIVFIECLTPKDIKLGQILFDAVKKKESEKANYFVTLHSVTDRDGFLAVLQELVDKTEEGTNFTLHIATHGDQKGLVIGSTTIYWKELFYYTRQLNIKMHNTLLLVLSSCVGGGILSYIEPEKRAPYMAIIANTREILQKDALKGFLLFYEDFYYPQDFRVGLEKLNASIDFTEKVGGRKKTEFFLMTAASSFDEVFNPDRDPKFYDYLIDKLIRSLPNVSQKPTRDEAKELLKKRAERLRPYFTFSENQSETLDDERLAEMAEVDL